MRGPCSYRPVIVDPRLALSLIGVGVARRFNVNRQANSKFRSRVGRMDHHTNPWPDSKSLYLLRGIAGAPVGAKIANAPEFHFLGVGTVIGAILGAAFFVIGRRQLQPP
jgi:hypothetical protein